MNRDIIVLGSMNVDFVVTVKRRPGKVRLCQAMSFPFFREAKVPISFVAAAKLGGKVAMAGRIGDDVFSKVVLAACRQPVWVMVLSLPRRTYLLVCLLSQWMKKGRTRL